MPSGLSLADIHRRDFFLRSASRPGEAERRSEVSGHTVEARTRDRALRLPGRGHRNGRDAEKGVVMRRSSIILLVVGVVLLAAAGVVRFAVYPAVKQLPSDYDRTATYSGTGTFLNPAAVASGNAANALLANQSITVTRHAKVTSTSGSTAVVSDDITGKLSNGTTVLSDNHVWAIDRKSMYAAPAPHGSIVDQHEGITIGFPIGVQPRDYTYWDANTEQAVPAGFQRTESYLGRAATVFTANASGPVKDPKLLAGLPSALPASALGSVASLLPPNVQTLLKTLGSALPVMLPLSYTSATKITSWIDTGTGLPLNVQQQQTVTADLSLAGSSQPLLPVLADSIANTTASINQAVHDATTAGVTLTLLGVTVPLVLLTLGILLIALALFLHYRRRRLTAVASTARSADPGAPNPPPDAPSA
jgi:DUF3068 family protein